MKKITPEIHRAILGAYINQPVWFNELNGPGRITSFHYNELVIKMDVKTSAGDSYTVVDSDVSILVRPLSAITDMELAAIGIIECDPGHKFKIDRSIGPSFSPGVGDVRKVHLISCPKNDGWARPSQEIWIVDNWYACQCINNDPRPAAKRYVWQLSLASYHYLLSKGFAMPYGDFSEAELVELGVFTLREHFDKFSATPQRPELKNDSADLRIVKDAAGTSPASRTSATASATGEHETSNN